MRVDVAQMTNPLPVMDASVEACPIILEERLGVRRVLEPVTVGIPFPKGMIVDPTMLMLSDQRSGETLYTDLELNSEIDNADLCQTTSLR